jgi:FecR-like protein
VSAPPSLDAIFASWRAVPTLRPLGRIRGPTGSRAVASALRAVAQRRRRQHQLRRLIGAAALAAGVFGLTLAGWIVARERWAAGSAMTRGVLLEAAAGEVLVLDDGGERVTGLVEGSGFRTGQGQASLRFPSGAVTRVSSQSSLELLSLEHAEAFLLTRGRVEVEVPKLGPNRGFVVQTPDLRVTVHGTAFSLDVEATSQGPRTRVSVTHGLVSVRHAGRELFLGAGQSWPLLGALPDPAQLGPAAPAASAPPTDVRAPQRSEQRSATHSSNLALQNQRFARAMQLKKNGAWRAALAQVERILHLYPASPLTQELYVERVRLQQRLGLAPELRHSALSYLRQFPQGYAEPEVRALLGKAL